MRLGELLFCHGTSKYIINILRGSRKNFCHTVCGGKCVDISFSRTMKMLMLEYYGMSRQLLEISGFAKILKKSTKFSFLGFD